MILGIPREIKTEEYRVGLTPAGARELCRQGHEVLVQAGAGDGAGFGDGEYRMAGACLVPDAKELWGKAELVVKVKEPQPEEISLLRPGQGLFLYLHLAAAPELCHALLQSGVVAIAYETVADAQGRLPLLAPMSEVAGRMAAHVAASCLEKERGGRGLLLGGVPGVERAKVVVLGGGVAGSNAARIALGLEAEVVVIERSLARITYLDELFGARLKTAFASTEAIEKAVLEADAVVGTVLIPGAAAPRLIGKNLVSRMKRGSVIVDVAIDQGGCCETSRPTTHRDPTYLVDEVVHYCVANMPGAVPRTSTFALTNATFPYVLDLAQKGIKQALAEDPMLASGLNICRGHLTHEAVARNLDLPYTAPGEALQSL